jgi:hypothetical protein
VHHQPADEVHIAGQAVELGHDDRRLVLPGQRWPRRNGG